MTRMSTALVRVIVLVVPLASFLGGVRGWKW
jgi:hypothetical protein